LLYIFNSCEISVVISKGIFVRSLKEGDGAPKPLATQNLVFSTLPRVNDRIAACITRSCSGRPPPLPTLRNIARQQSLDSGNLPAGANDVSRAKTTDLAQNGSQVRTVLDFHVSFPIKQRFRQVVIRSGSLWKCKYAEAGKRVKWVSLQCPTVGVVQLFKYHRKQWSCCFAYLTGAHLIFYRDEKAAQVVDF